MSHFDTKGNMLSRRFWARGWGVSPLRGGVRARPVRCIWLHNSERRLALAYGLKFGLLRCNAKAHCTLRFLSFSTWSPASPKSDTGYGDV